MTELSPTAMPAILTEPLGEAPRPAVALALLGAIQATRRDRMSS